jgi:16S rRNA (uracil1498-N3)-methyltransferase
MKKENGLCVISGAEAKHITRVLRMTKGDRFILINGAGERYEAVIESAGHKEVLASIARTLPHPPPSPIEITLCQSILKSGPMDYVIQKTSELGVNRILPFISERTVAIPDENKSNRLRHWKEIALSSTKQSGRFIPAEIGAVSSLEQVLIQWNGKDALKIILWEDENTKDLKDVIRNTEPTGSVAGIIGPEGGFSRQEVLNAKDAGFISVSLGQRILRAETAAITFIAIAQYEWGDLSSNYYNSTSPIISPD